MWPENLDGEGSMSWRPTFATGEFAGDYTDLKKYLEEAKKTNEECYNKAILSNEDFEWIKELVEKERRINVQDLLKRIEERMKERVCGEIAAKALNMDEDYAKSRVARLLAAWLLEAALQWGILKKSRE